ncbi:hypothetical protein SanaruYs_15580 [Chryseotalea sanaruensis]|uniref:Carboxypeptidase-like regulatory domain-containing protein n=1 Tax=Chryseotalea sanaruensis TaxID=2482724 RepID=A0A401U8Y7_9BACT|nr:carboxypeptidase-like regulatory domain-containing protein [Chryseotalea sanaruensis]GCC51334.1 hypothetical protein SanaruYs_15580 [Chryseotalea sanaruensis]
MRGFLIILFVVCFNLAQAQTITLSGKVVDKISQESLAFASIGIKGKSLGVISNLQGEFDFYIPNEFRNEILVISMLGYKSYEAPIWSITGSSLVRIEMERSTTFLKELIVEDSLKGGDVLRIALARANDNLPQKPFLLDGFYRDIKRVGGTYISLMEAAVQIYDEDSKEPRNKHKLKERVKLVEMRQSLGYESKFTTYFDQDNLLEDLLLNNNIRYRQIDAREELFAVMNREKDSYYNGHEIFVVAYTGEYSLRFFIDKEDFAIIRFEFKTNTDTQDVVGKRKNLEGRFAGTDKVVEFKRYEGKMYISFMKMTSAINWYDLEKNELKFKTELFQQLLINNINTNPLSRIGATESMKRYGLQFQHFNYNKDFWDSYNVIKRTPLDSQIIADLEKAGPLEKQFEEN